MIAVLAAICSLWKDGSMILRERRWKSPSIVSIPSPSSGISWPKPPSRQRKSFMRLTRIVWLASGPIMKTCLEDRIRIVKTGPWRS